jgi:hypothetical protein
MAAHDGAKEVPYSLFRDPTDRLVLALRNQIEREFPSALSGVPGVQPFFVILIRVIANTYDAIRFLAADIPKESRPKPEYGLATAPLVRTFADLLSTLVFMSEDFPKRSDWFHRSGWRELFEDYDRHQKEYGALPEWNRFLTEYRARLDASAKMIGITAQEAAAPTSIDYWPIPTQMLAKSSPIQPQNRAFLEYVRDWLYRGLSQKSHMSAAGITQAHGLLLLKDEEGREERLMKFKSDAIFTSTTLIACLGSEINSTCGFGRDKELWYIWTLLVEHWGEAEDLFKLRYKAMLKV